MYRPQRAALARFLPCRYIVFYNKSKSLTVRHVREAERTVSVVFERRHRVARRLGCLPSSAAPPAGRSCQSVASTGCTLAGFHLSTSSHRARQKENAVKLDKNQKVRRCAVRSSLVFKIKNVINK